ncbi:MAG: dTMP kinase [Acidimicrobiales bacterium]|jgi:dTMP kinase
MAAAAGRLIAIEGVEGAGKSTQAARLALALDADLTREPGGTPIGERVRQLLLDPGSGALDDLTELLLMLAARAQHLSEKIEPALRAGRHVVVDRFSGSTLAYQGYGRGLALEDVRKACDLATRGRWADLNVLIDVPVAVGSTRRAAGPDRIEAETAAFHERVRDGFLAEAAADPEHWCVVGGEAPADEIAAAILRAVTGRLDIDLEVVR